MILRTLKHHQFYDKKQWRSPLKIKTYISNLWKTKQLPNDSLVKPIKALAKLCGETTIYNYSTIYFSLVCSVMSWWVLIITYLSLFYVQKHAFAEVYLKSWCYFEPLIFVADQNLFVFWYQSWAMNFWVLSYMSSSFSSLFFFYPFPLF